MIRFANKFDLDCVVDLIFEFGETSDIGELTDKNSWDRQYIKSILIEIISGRGFILIDENKTGILIAVKNQLLWVKNHFQLQEVMLHCKNKITMMKLIKEYIKIARQMIKENKICHAVMFSETNAKFEKLGLNKLEIAWEIH